MVTMVTIYFVTTFFLNLSKDEPNRTISKLNTYKLWRCCCLREQLWGENLFNPIALHLVLTDAGLGRGWITVANLAHVHIAFWRSSSIALFAIGITGCDNKTTANKFQQVKNASGSVHWKHQARYIRKFKLLSSLVPTLCTTSPKNQETKHLEI